MRLRGIAVVVGVTRRSQTFLTLVLVLVIALLGACPAGGAPQPVDRAGVWSRATAQDEPSPGDPTALTGAGFDSIHMVTTIGVDAFERTITYNYWGEGDEVPEPLRAAFDAFFAELEAAGVSVTVVIAEGAYRMWVASLEADSPGELASLTNVALRSESTQFEVTPGPVDEPGTTALAVVDVAECAAICEPTASVTDELIVADEYVAPDAFVTEEGNVFTVMSTTPDLIEYQLAQVFESVSFELSVGVGGELTWTAEFFADAAAEEVAGATLIDALAWNDGWPRIETARSDEGTTYTVTVQGDDIEEFLESYDAWSGEGYWTYLSRRDLQDLHASGPGHERYRLEGLLVLPSSLEKHLPAGDSEMSIVVPAGYSVTSHVDRPGIRSGEGDLAGYATVVFDAEVSGSPQEDAASSGGIPVFPLVAVLTLFLVFRKRIRAAITGWREAATARRPDGSAARRLAEASAAPGVPGAPGAHVAPGAPGAWSPWPVTNPPIPEQARTVGEVPPPPPPPDDVREVPAPEVPSILDRLDGIRTAELPPPPAPWTGSTTALPDSTADEPDA